MSVALFRTLITMGQIKSPANANAIKQKHLKSPNLALVAALWQTSPWGFCKAKNMKEVKGGQGVILWSGPQICCGFCCCSGRGSCFFLLPWRQKKGGLAKVFVHQAWEWLHWLEERYGFAWVSDLNLNFLQEYISLPNIVLKSLADQWGKVCEAAGHIR